MGAVRKGGPLNLRTTPLSGLCRAPFLPQRHRRVAVVSKGPGTTMARKADKSRPMIWAEGRQHPKLDAKSFALASVGFAREGLCGLLERCAASAVALRTTSGDAGDGRLTRLVRGTGRLLDQAARWVGGQDEPPPDTIFRPAEAAPRPEADAVIAPAQPIAPARAHSLPLDPDLALLRTVISEARAQGRTGASATRADPQAEAAEPHAQAPKRRLAGRMAGAMLGFGLLVVSVPYGMVRAILAHMDGQDLRREA